MVWFFKKIKKKEEKEEKEVWLLQGVGAVCWRRRRKDKMSNGIYMSFDYFLRPNWLAMGYEIGFLVHQITHPSPTLKIFSYSWEFRIINLVPSILVDLCLK